MSLPLRARHAFRLPLLAAAIVVSPLPVVLAADEGMPPAAIDRGADEAIGALVAFLQKPDEHDGGHRPDGASDGQRERDERGAQGPRAGGPGGRGERGRRPGGPAGRRPFDDGPPSAPRPQPPHGAAPRSPRWIAPVAPPAPGRNDGPAPQVRAFSLQVGPDGVTKGIEIMPPAVAPFGTMHEGRAITVQVDGGQLKLEGVPGPHADPHAIVANQLQVIIGKLNAIESRLGGPGPHGPMPPHAPAPLPGAPHPGGPQHPGPQHPGPQPLHQPGQPVPPPAVIGSNPDEINRRFEEHARDLHRHVEEMARGLREKLEGSGGMGEEIRKHHEKIVRAHEQIQERFQDIRRRFAEQQERIERLEQEVKRLHEQHGPARHERDGRKGESRNGEREDRPKQGATRGDDSTQRVSHDVEEPSAL